MTKTKNYSFKISPNTNDRYIAGEYNIKTKQPKYRLNINVPEHVLEQVVINQFLLGDKNYCEWGWDIHNNSSWIIFVTVKKDGIPIYENNS